MTIAIAAQSDTERIDVLLRLSAITGRPPYLSGQAAGNHSIAALEEVRLAQEELGRWQAAFDGNSEGDPDEYHREIRTAEKRLRSALASTGGRKIVALALTAFK